MASTLSLSSNIDVNGIVQALMDVERQPLTRLESRAAGIRTTISEVGRLQSALSTFQDATRDLKDADTWGVATATTSDDTAVNVSASSGALQGSYAVQVNQLASHQTIVSTPLADGEAVIGGGQLTIELGTADGGFTPAPDSTPFTIDIAAGATLEDVSAAINAADVGVGASLVTDSNGTRIMIRSESSGESAAFRITGTADGSSGSALDLAALSYTPGQADGTVIATEQAANAQFLLNGLALESESNRPENVLDNVAFSFSSVTEAPVEIDIVSDAEAIRENLDTFVSAYNELNGLIREQTRYDQATDTAGPLQGNSTVLMIQSQLRSLVGLALPEEATGDSDEAFSRLTDIGIEVQRDGSLRINDDRYEVAANNPSRLQALFASGGVEPETHGFARRFDTLVTDLLSVDGAITVATDTLNRREDLIQDQQERLERRLADIEERLLRQYTNLDANLSQLNSALNTVSNL